MFMRMSLCSFYFYILVIVEKLLDLIMLGGVRGFLPLKFF